MPTTSSHPARALGLRTTRAALPSSSWTATSATALRTSRTPRGPRRALGDEEVRLTSAATAGRGAQFLVPTASASTSPPASAARGAALAASGRRSLRPTGQVPRACERDRPDATARLAGGVGSHLPVFPADAKGIAGRDASEQGSQRARPEHPVVSRMARRISGRRTSHPDVRGCRTFPGPDPAARSAFRHPRALDGRHRQRSLAVEVRAFARRSSSSADYARPAIRLSALMSCRPSWCSRTTPWRRRGRPDPPAGGAAGIAARHPGLVTLRPGDTNEGRGGVPLRDAAPPPAGRARAVTAAVADAGSAHIRPPPRAYARVRYCSRIPRRESEVILIASAAR